MIQLIDVAVQSGKFALHRLNWEVPTGKYAVLMGASGTGKTTILEAICGLSAVKSGEIRIHGRNVTHAPPGQRQIGYVPQDLALFPSMTVQQQIEFALKLRGWSKSARSERLEELAELLQIGPLLNRPIQNLSGGEAQRVALGRALSFRPDVVLLDEPLSALDESSRLRLQVLLKQTQQATRVTFLHVTHQLSEARALADRITVLRDNHLVGLSPLHQ